MPIRTSFRAFGFLGPQAQSRPHKQPQSESKSPYFRSMRRHLTQQIISGLRTTLLKDGLHYQLSRCKSLPSARCASPRGTRFRYEISALLLCPLLMCARIYWQSTRNGQDMVPRSPQTSLQSPKLDFCTCMDSALRNNGLFISSRRSRRDGNSL